MSLHPYISATVHMSVFLLSLLMQQDDKWGSTWMYLTAGGAIALTVYKDFFIYVSVPYT